MFPSSGSDVVSSAHTTLILTVAVFKTTEIYSIHTWLIAKEAALHIGKPTHARSFKSVIVCLCLSFSSHYKEA